MSRFSVVIGFLIMLLKLTSGHFPVVPYVSCPQPPVQEGFNLTRFLGRWYELYIHFNGSRTLNCYTVDYYAFNRTLWANGTYQQKSDFDDSYSKTSNAIGTFSSSEPAKITVVQRGYIAYYWILDTDYTNYALVWSCNGRITAGGNNNAYTEYAWILGRRNTLSQEIFDSIVQKFPRYGLNREYLVKHVQDGSCTYPTCL